MDMVTLGSTGITVNKNGFGALPIQRISEEDAVMLLRKAYNAGMRFIREHPEGQLLHRHKDRSADRRPAKGGHRNHTADAQD